MKRRRAGRAWLVAGLVYSLAAGADLLDELAARVDDGIRGRFQQSLTAPGVEQPWVASGRFDYRPGEGLTWRLQQPTTARLRIDARGQVEVEGELAGLDIMRRRTVARLVVAMVTLDRAVLERYYTLSWQRHDDGFVVELIALPRWQRQAGNVRLRGDEHVEQVEFTFDDGRGMTLELVHER